MSIWAKLKISRQATLNGGIKSREEYDRLKSEQADADKKIAALKTAFKDCESIYKVYADIADTYNKISKGDYISNLIEEKRRQDDLQKKKSKGR